MNKGLDCFALTITIIGAINWGLIGFFSFDLVAWLFGNDLAVQDHLWTGGNLWLISDLFLWSLVRKIRIYRHLSEK